MQRACRCREGWAGSAGIAAPSRAAFRSIFLHPTETRVLSPVLPHLILVLQKASKYGLGWNPGFQVESAQPKPAGLEPKRSGSVCGLRLGHSVCWARTLRNCG